MTNDAPSQALTTIEGGPVMSVAQAISVFKQIAELASQALTNGKDFGVIPGCGDKPALLKPGAEKLCRFFGLNPTYEVMDKIEQWDEPQHVYYMVRCTLSRGGVAVGDGLGSCSSNESKHRRDAAPKKVCPVCGATTIFRSKYADRGQPQPGWYCWKNKGGCGATFDVDTKFEETAGAGGDVANVANTILKMAQKRAFVGATLNCTSASEFYTQDIEDIEDAADAAPAEKPTRKAKVYDASDVGRPDAEDHPAEPADEDDDWAAGYKEPPPGDDRDSEPAPNPRQNEAASIKQINYLSVLLKGHKNLIPVDLKTYQIDKASAKQLIDKALKDPLEAVNQLQEWVDMEEQAHSDSLLGDDEPAARPVETAKNTNVDAFRGR